MSLINEVATYRGIVTDRAVGITTNGYPQFVVQLKAEEIYDNETQEWVDWSGADENEITAYLCLFDGKDNETLSCKQIKKVFGWDGKSFIELNEIDISETKVQFRVVERTYNEKTSLQVEWIDEYDAQPGRSVRKLDTGDLKTLQAKYNPVLKATSGGVTPAKAPKSLPKVPAKRIISTTKIPVVNSSVESKDEPTKDSNNQCTKQEAWDECVTRKAVSVQDKQLTEAWLNAITEIAPKKTDEKITPKEWFQIMTIVLEATADDIPF